MPFGRANERADHSTLDLPRQLIRVETRGRQEPASVLEAVHPSRLDAHVVEPDVGQEPLEFALLERARDAADPELHAPADFGGELALDDDVAHREAAARL